MKNFKPWCLAIFAALLLAACGGGGDGDQSPRVRYTALVSFGDSLSDIGSYATAGLKASTGGLGGKYTVNSVDSKNWTELLAAAAAVTAPCPAQTGLESSGPLAALAQAKADHPGCFGYAQGGARVTNPVGPGNKALIPNDRGGYVGQLTDPLVNQINRHLVASGGAFSGKELVTVLAGGNDAIINLRTSTPTDAVLKMGQAGAELAGYIKSMIVGKGATRVVVVTLPDLSQTPLGYSQPANVQALINTMVTTFNAQLTAGLTGVNGVLVVDLFMQVRLQTADPAQYAITNGTTPACDVTKAIFDSALACTTATTIAADTSHYAFADSIHPTPYGYRLIAQFVTDRMLKAGWL